MSVHGDRTPPRRSEFARFVAIDTRWSDNDVYGHVNNVVYYSYFDTVVNGLLVESGLLEPAAAGIIGLVAHTRCDFFAPVAFPERLEVGVAVERIGRSSVTYRLAVFKRGTERAAAEGRFTHVYVTRANGAPTPIPERHRAHLTALVKP